MISFSIVFFLPLTFLLLRCLSAVSNSSIYVFSFFSHSFYVTFIVIPIAISVFFASISHPLSGHLLSLPVYHLPFVFDMTSPYTPHQFLLRIFLQFNLHSPLIHFLFSSLLTPTIILTGCFLQTGTFSCCFYVSAIVSSAFMCAGVKHEVSTFFLRIRDMRLSPITPSTFL